MEGKFKGMEIRFELICPNCGHGEDEMEFKANGEVICNSCGFRVKKV